MTKEELSVGQKVELPAKVAGIYDVGPETIVHVKLKDGRTLQTSLMNLQPATTIVQLQSDSEPDAKPRPKGNKKAEPSETK